MVKCLTAVDRMRLCKWLKLKSCYIHFTTQQSCNAYSAYEVKGTTTTFHETVIVIVIFHGKFFVFLLRQSLSGSLIQYSIVATKPSASAQNSTCSHPIFSL